MFNFCASLIAICSRLISITNSAPGRRVISEIDPKFFSSFALKRSTCKRSFFESVKKVPSFFMRSMVAIFLTALRIVTKLVSIPPGHLSVMYGMLTFAAFSETMSFACFLVATNKILRPEVAIFAKACEASSSFAAVLYRLMI